LYLKQLKILNTTFQIHVLVAFLDIDTDTTEPACVQARRVPQIDHNRIDYQRYQAILRFRFHCIHLLSPVLFAALICFIFDRHSKQQLVGAETWHLMSKYIYI